MIGLNDSEGFSQPNQEILDTLITFLVYLILLKCLIEIKYFDILTVEILHFIQLTQMLP